MSNGEFVLVCSCLFWKKHGRACRHMYAVLQRHPMVRDAKIRWHNGYDHEYGVNDASSVKYLELRDKFAYPGVPLTIEDVARIKESIKVGEGERPLDFFNGHGGGSHRTRTAGRWVAVAMTEQGQPAWDRAWPATATAE